MLKSPALGDTVLGGMDVTIGRAHDNTYVIDDLQVSGHDAVIRQHGRGYAIFDLKSKNATFVNDQKLPPEMAHVLRHGDSICVGEVIFEYSDDISIAATLTQEASVRAAPRTGTDLLPGNLPQQEFSLISTRSGRMLKRRYWLLEAGGLGGMGRVYLAQDTKQGNSLVAVKVMSLSRLMPQEFSQAVEQFRHEADLLASLDHPNIPAVHDYFGESDRWYLVMSLLKGKTSREFWMPLQETDCQLMKWYILGSNCARFWNTSTHVSHRSSSAISNRRILW